MILRPCFLHDYSWVCYSVTSDHSDEWVCGVAVILVAAFFSGSIESRLLVNRSVAGKYVMVMVVGALPDVSCYLVKCTGILLTFTICIIFSLFWEINVSTSIGNWVIRSEPIILSGSWSSLFVGAGMSMELTEITVLLNSDDPLRL